MSSTSSYNVQVPDYEAEREREAERQRQLEEERQRRLARERELVAQVQANRQRIEQEIGQYRTQQAQREAEYERLMTASQASVEAAASARLRQQAEALQASIAHADQDIRQRQEAYSKLTTSIAEKAKSIGAMERMNLNTFMIYDTLQSVLAETGDLRMAQLEEKDGNVYVRFAHEEIAERIVDMEIALQNDTASLHFDVRQGFVGDECHTLLRLIEQRSEDKGLKLREPEDRRRTTRSQQQRRERN